MIDLVVEKHCVYLDDLGNTVWISRVLNFDRKCPFEGVVFSAGGECWLQEYSRTGEVLEWEPPAHLVKKLDCPPIDFSVFGQMNEYGDMAMFTSKSTVGVLGTDRGFGNYHEDSWNPVTEEKIPEGYVLRPDTFEDGEEYGKATLIDELIALLESKREK